MGSYLFSNVRIIDGSGASAYAGEVLVQGNRIARVNRTGAGMRALPTAGVTVVDARGATLMPGMTEAHTHFSWNNAASLDGIQVMPTEEHMLWVTHVARKYLDHGWTSCVGAATAKPRLDVVIRNAIEAGEWPGPRYLAASQEITVAGSLGDESLPHITYPEYNFGAVVSGAEEMRKVVRMFLKYGVDTIKVNLSGDNILAHAGAKTTWITDEEFRVACEETHLRGKRVAVHARSLEGVRMALRHGAELIFHASYTDSETLDGLEAAKDRIFIVPTFSVLVKLLYEGEPYGFDRKTALAHGYEEELEACARTMTELHKRGVRILPGGDYGFAWAPHWTNAMDLQYLVKYCGMTPMEAIVAATRHGGAIMMRPDELGQIREGMLADLLLVDGDPVADLALLLDQKRLLAVMKDGAFHKSPELRSERSRWDRSAA
ncbi:MAG: amidohydrolase family protein [Lautropia sp.]